MWAAWTDPGRGLPGLSVRCVQNRLTKLKFRTRGVFSFYHRVSRQVFSSHLVANKMITYLPPRGHPCPVHIPGHAQKSLGAALWVAPAQPGVPGPPCTGGGGGSVPPPCCRGGPEAQSSELGVSQWSWVWRREGAPLGQAERTEGTPPGAIAQVRRGGVALDVE